MAPTCLIDTSISSICRDVQAATYLKLASILLIFLGSAVGVASPVLFARYFRERAACEKVVQLIKSFAAGVILSTALIHVLPEAFDSLLDCHVAARFPWRDFPFAGLLTLCGCLTALLVDITASSHLHGEHLIQPDRYSPVSGTELCHEDVENGELMTKLKQRVVSQVLEIGIIFHSVIIGITLGMSQNRCTIKSLVVALSFHQAFEGIGLGGCITQAEFGARTVAFMGLMFSATTPLGILLGMIAFALTGYDESEPNALIMEGLLGAFSSGILIYMGLVDLIAVDFFQNKLMNHTPWLKKASFIALLLGTVLMSILALWA